MLNMTKIREGIERVEIRVKMLSESEKQRLEETLELTTREFVAFQEIKSIAQAKGEIDLETAFFIYNTLGNWQKTDIATKAILTQVFAMLLLSKS